MRNKVSAPSSVARRRLTASGTLVVLLLLGLSGAAAAAPSAPVVAEVEYLLAYVQQAGCVFYRNGDAHGPAEAASHIRKKYEHFRNKIDSTDEFIRRAATGSLMSGKPYQVQCPDDRDRRATADWLREALREYRAPG